MHFAVTTEASTALQRLGQVPTDFWIKIAIGVAVIVALVLVFRKLAQMNKVVLVVVAGLVVSAFGFSWIYERNEPHWATPAVSFLADFFPSKDRVEHW